MAFQLSVEFKWFVCRQCGCPWAVPDGLEYSPCPSCARRREQAVREERDAARAESVRLERQISHVRGALTRLKRRRAKES